MIAAADVRSYVSDDDSLVLEDEFGRIKLNAAGVPVKSLVTGACAVCDRVWSHRALAAGLVVSLLGEDTGGEFKVTRMFHPGIAPQPALPQRKRDVLLSIASHN